jgi:hypothetical protein
VTGTASVSGSAQPASGGGSGGGGSSAGTDTTTPTPPSTPAIVTPPAAEPLGPQDSPIANSLQPGGTVVTVGGEQVPVTTTPKSKTGSVAGSGDGWTLEIGGRMPSGGVKPLSSTGVVQIPQGGGVHVSGSGYEPGTTVPVYALNPALLLGTFTVGADGSFSGTVTLPAAIRAGDAVIQVNGYASAGVVRSYSLGVKVARNAAAKVRTVTATVYFAAGSSWLNPTARTVLDGLVAAVPKGAKSVSVVCTGYVQETPSTSNDYTLSTQRAAKTAAQLKADHLSGKYYATGRGIAKDTGAKGRKVIVTITYTVR